VVGVVGLAYLGFLAASLRVPPSASAETDLARALEREHLTYGLAAYWQASTVTVASGDRVRVRAVDMGSPVPGPYLWEARSAWYDRRVPGNDARFVVRDTADPRSVDRKAVEAAFGPPSEVRRYGRYEVLIWDRDLLARLGD